jgi:coenzyme F420-0:L-glutamate ligase/coenzyme F420-1:gamma-L-glutamate ligase
MHIRNFLNSLGNSRWNITNQPTVFFPIPHPRCKRFFRDSTDNYTGMNITVIPVMGLPLIGEGDDLAGMLSERMPFEDDDILCVASSVYSKAKGYTRNLSSIKPGDRAIRIGRACNEDPRFIQAVIDESADILVELPFILSCLPCGHVGVRAGVDQSNIEDGKLILLPPDPMGAADELRTRIGEITGRSVRVILSDTCGRSFRRGQTGTAIGWSGMQAIRDYRGDHDLFGHELQITEEAVVDEIAGFANFVMGESNQGVPAVVFRNCPVWQGHDEIYFRQEEDITRTALKKMLIQ